MDPCGLLFGSVCVLGLIALLGHGLWLFVAWLVRQIFGSPLPPEQPPTILDRLVTCVRCGSEFRSSQSSCWKCGLDPDSPTAIELRELVTTARRVQHFLDNGVLDPETAERVYRCIEERQNSLLERGMKGRVEETPPQPAAPVEHIAPEEVLAPITLTAADVVDPEPPPAVPATPPPPRRTLAQVLASFMEQRNILWGELVGGLLIVGCSIALVVSLWQTLGQVPYFPFLIFALLTGAVFGTGLYTMRRWKLESTSRGLLVIATLLVPLDFLILARLQGQAILVVELIVEILALIGLTGVVAVSARVLFGFARVGVLLPLGVIGAALCQMLTPRLLDPASPAWVVFVLGMVPAVCHALAVVGILWRQPAEDRTALSLFGFLGLTTFALAVALGFIVYRTSGSPQALQGLSVPIAVAGIAIAFTGGLSRRKLVEPSAGLVLLATSIVLVGVLVQLMAVVLAWTASLVLVAVCGLIFAGLTVVALLSRLPVLHVPALLSLGLGFLAGFGLLVGRSELSPTADNGMALTLLAFLLAASAEGFFHKGRSLEGLFHATASGVAGVLALLVVSFGIGATTLLGAGVFAACGIGGIVVNARWRRVELLAFFQGVLTMAVILAVTVGLQSFGRTSQLVDTRNLHVYGLGLAGLSFGWILLRLAVRSFPNIRQMLDPHRVTVDRIVLTFVVVGQLFLAILHVTPAVGAELSPAGSESLTLRPLAVTMPEAWTLLGGLAIVLCVAFLDKPRESALGLTLLVLTVPVLSAEGFSQSLASASALRWGLAGCFVACSVPLWLGGSIGRATTNINIAWPTRVLVVGGAVMPVLLLTAMIAVLGFTGNRPAGPLADTLFAQMGWVASNVGPLLLIGLGLAGHGLALGSSGYVFAAGLVLTMTLAGGYALGVVTGGGLLDARQLVRVLQLTGIAVGLWALIWLSGRRWIPGWREGPALSPSRLRMQIQLGLGVAVAAILLGPAVYLLVGLTPTSAWTQEVGSLGGAAVLGLVSGAVLFRRWQQHGTTSPTMIGAISLAAVGLLACGVERAAPGWGLRTLLLGCGCCALAWAMTRVEPRDAEPWIAACGALTVGVGLKAAVAFPDHLWAVAAIALSSAAATVTAVRHRRETWALAAAVGVYLAVGLFVWWRHLGEPFSTWMVPLLQTSLTVAALASLMWLSVSLQSPSPPLAGERGWGEGVGVSAERTPSPPTPLPRKRRRGELSLPLVGFHLALTLAGHFVLLLAALVAMIGNPGGLVPLFVIQTGQVGGWLALLLTLLAVWAYALSHMPSLGVHVLGVSGMLLGVLASCTAAAWSPGSWLSHHVLTVSWSLCGVALLAAGWVATTCDRIGPGFWDPERRQKAATLARVMLAPFAVRRWVEIVSLLVVLLAVRGVLGDPTQPYGAAAAVLAVAVLLGALAVWSRQPFYVYASGLLLNLVGFVVGQGWLIDRAGFLAWRVYVPGVLDTLLFVQVLCLAVGSATWSLLELRWPRVAGTWPGLPFRHFAGLAALHLVAALVISGIAGDLASEDMHLGGVMAWVALAATVAALTLFLWDKGTTWRAGPLYVSGLLAILLALHQASLSPAEVGHLSAVCLAGFVLSTSVLGWAVKCSVWPRWFLASTALLTTVALVLSVWIATSFAHLTERLVGPGTAGLLFLAGIVLAEGFRRSSLPVRLHEGVLGLGVLTLTEIGWAFLDPHGPAPWLHRSVLLLAATALLSLGYGLGLTRLARSLAEWTIAARRLGPWLGVLACGLLVVVLVQEFLLYDPILRSTPLAGWASLAVAAVLLGLIVSAILFAVKPGLDPFTLPERWRTLYVYVAEVLIVGLLLHVRLNVPDWLPAFLGEFWPLVVMTVAFAVIGLSELFHRRGLPVLAGPLRRTGIFLPLLPLAAFLLRPLAEPLAPAGVAVPGLQPLLRYLERLPEGYGMHSLLWFLLGLLYVVTALARRSWLFALLAAVAANFGLWAVFSGYESLVIWQHPQSWLIPPALIVLAAGWLHRDRLTTVQRETIRYGALLLIYLSSTADMFIAGLGRSVVLPLALALLCVAGVLAGIVLRVRAFLLTGVVFLFLVVASQIWHAAVDQEQTWVWWASGIVLGAAILALFALFEKRRNDVLKVVDEIKRWD